MSGLHVIGLDLGGTNIKAVLVDEDGTVLARTILDTEATKGPDHVIGRMHLAAAQNPSKDPPDNDWIERLFLPLVDQLGPGVVTLAAMLFPDDKAKPILEVLEQHMRTREAEAKAAAAEAEGPDVIDVEGESTE